MTTSEIFANRLKELREEKGLSQTQIADALGVSRGSISYYENGERTPDIGFLAQVKEYFTVELDYLLGYSDHKHKKKESFDANTFACLPQYVQIRIESAKNQMAECAQAYVPANGNDPYAYFDLLQKDVLSVIHAYSALERDIAKISNVSKLDALKKFKENMNCTSEVDLTYLLFKDDFQPRKVVFETFVRSPESIAADEKKNRRWGKKK